MAKAVPLTDTGETAQSDDDLTYISAGEARRRFKERTLSPVELMTALQDRAAQTEDRVNAFADSYADEAMALAKRAESKFMKTDGRLRPLEGLPLTVKDDTAIKGRRTTVGSLTLKDHIDDHTSPSVERLLKAGAIVHARTTCPEFAWPWVCYTRIHGTTRNPWNLDVTPGGSSSGAAASLAAGSSILATGTDSAGSIRMPAAMCGVVGYKPPSGRNPLSPEESFDYYLQIGPMARSVEDCVMMQNVMAGPHPLDHTTIKPKLRIAWPPKGIDGLKIAYSHDLGCHEIAHDVRAATDEALTHLRDAGAQVDEVAVDWAAAPISVSYLHGNHLYADEFAEAAERHRAIVSDYVPYYAKGAVATTRRQFRDTMRLAGRVWHDHFGPMMKRYDLFICPTVATTEIDAELPPWADHMTINGKPVDADGGYVMTSLFNMFSRCPVLSVPSGLGANGVPAGIQIVGRPFDDTTVFRAAAALEASNPWYRTSAKRPGL